MSPGLKRFGECRTVVDYILTRKSEKKNDQAVCMCFFYLKERIEKQDSGTCEAVQGLEAETEEERNKRYCKKKQR